MPEKYVLKWKLYTLAFFHQFLYLFQIPEWVPLSSLWCGNCLLSSSTSRNFILRILTPSRDVLCAKLSILRNKKTTRQCIFLPSHKSLIIQKDLVPFFILAVTHHALKLRTCKHCFSGSLPSCHLMCAFHVFWIHCTVFHLSIYPFTLSSIHPSFHLSINSFHNDSIPTMYCGLWSAVNAEVKG